MPSWAAASVRLASEATAATRSSGRSPEHRSPPATAPATAVPVVLHFACFFGVQKERTREETSKAKNERNECT